MKDLMLLLVLALIGIGGFATYKGISNSVNFHYMCGAEIPWYDALLLDRGQCPGFGTHSAPAASTGGGH